MDHSWPIRSLTAATLVLAATPARADDPYPTELVERAPYLPRGMTEILTTESLTDRGLFLGTSMDAALDVRRSFGVVEPLVDVQVHSTSDSRQALSAVGVGARVPVTRRSDVRASVRSMEPADPRLKDYGADVAFEARQPLIAHRLALSGAAGGSASRVSQLVSLPSGPPVLARTTDELAFVRGTLELQTGPRFVVLGGAELDLERWFATATLGGDTRPVEDRTMANAIYTVGFVSTTPRFDLGVSISRGKAGTLHVSAAAATFAARF
jgi:hypothetical protein